MGPFPMGTSVNIDHLLDLTRQLAAGSSKRPRQIELRRAVSSLYYAMFHALALMNANQIAGSTRRRSDAWVRVYRALDHVKTKDELRRRDVRSLSPQIGQFAILFVELQDLRHEADYDPRPFAPNKQQVLAMISQAEKAIEGLETLPPDLRTQLAAIVLLKARN